MHDSEILFRRENVRVKTQLMIALSYHNITLFLRLVMYRIPRYPFAFQPLPNAPERVRL